MVNLGVIGGGAMGSALIKGVINQGLVTSENLFVIEVDVMKQEILKKSFGINIVESLTELATKCSTIILAVKPNGVPGVMREFATKDVHNHLIISIAAGVTLATLENLFPQGRYIRVMPNTPARIGKGVAAYASGKNIGKDDEEQVAAVFGCVGKVIKVPEHLLDAVTGVSGSGPAYVYYFIEALVDAAVMVGLTRPDALVLVTETVLGSAELLKETGEDPAKLKSEVTSAGGTTAAALFELQKGACAGTLMKAVLAAVEKSKELGKG